MRYIKPGSILLAIAAISGCGKGSQKDRSPEPTPVEVPAEPSEELPQTVGKKIGKSGRTPLFTEFLKTQTAKDQKTRIDVGQVILTNSNGDVVIAGVTRSRIDKSYIEEPSLAGDLFFARYTLGKGFSSEPIQVPVVAPPPPAATPEDPTPKQLPLLEPLIEARGGRLLDSGMSIVVGDLINTQFTNGQLFLTETLNAKRTIFASIFGANGNGMVNAFRYGLTGENSVAGTASGSSDNTVLIAGRTDSGLLNNGTQNLSTAVPVPSNFLAELNHEGTFKRFYAWPELNANGITERVKAVASAKNNAFVAFEKGEHRSVFVKGLRMPDRSETFLDLPERQVCAKETANATSVKVASIAASETEVVVAVEITNATVDGRFSMPCFEVFAVMSSGNVVATRELVFLNDVSTIAGTTRVNILRDGKILLARTRANTDSLGAGGLIITLLYDRPLNADHYESSVSALSRPAEWIGDQSVDGLMRNVRSTAWAKDSKNEDVVWILSNDVKQYQDSRESLVHFGIYSAVKTEDKK